MDWPLRPPISLRSLLRRINRRLAVLGEFLHKSRSIQMEITVGTYYITDLDHNYIVHPHVDVEELGRELGVLQPWETVA